MQLSQAQTLIKAQYQAWETSYEDALAALEKTGLNEGQADIVLWGDGYKGERIPRD